MSYRSWLFVPGDNEKRLGMAVATGADAIAVDLEGPVAPAAKQAARHMAGEWLKIHRRQIVEQRLMARWVRINPLDSRMWREDLVAVIPGAPEGIILPQAAGPEAVRELGAELYEIEQASQVPAGSTKIVAIVGETAKSALAIATFAETPLPRLAGLAWSAEGLAALLGATRCRDARGGPTDALRFVRAQTLLAASACGVMALETLHNEITDEKGFKLAVKDARADGFTGMLSNHPSQVAEINAAFAPTDDEIEDARRIVAALDDGPAAGDLIIDRRVIGQHQVKQAKRMLGLVEQRGQDRERPPILRPA